MAAEGMEEEEAAKGSSCEQAKVLKTNNWIDRAAASGMPIKRPMKSSLCNDPFKV